MVNSPDGRSPEKRDSCRFWGRGYFSVQIVAVSVAEDVKPQMVEAEGIGGADAVAVSVGGFFGVDDGDGAFAHDADEAFSFEDGAGVFVDADAVAIGVHGDRAQQAGHAISVVKVLVYDDFGNDAQAGRHIHKGAIGRFAAAAPGNHVVAHDGCSGTGACQNDLAELGFEANRFHEGSVGQQGAQAQLVTAGHEDAGAVFEISLPDGIFALAAFADVEDFDLGCAHLLKNGAVAIADDRRFARSAGNDGDAGFGFASSGKKGVQNLAPVHFIFRSANDHDRGSRRLRSPLVQEGLGF